MEVNLKRSLDEGSQLIAGPSPSKTVRLGPASKNGQVDSSPAGLLLKPTIRVRENLTQKVVTSTTLPTTVVSARPNNEVLENEIKLLKEEVKALHWLARRKEQEWDNVVRLLKQKEERLLRSERQYSLGKSETSQFLRTAQNLCAGGLTSGIVDDNIMSNSGTIGNKPDVTLKQQNIVTTEQLASYFKLSNNSGVVNSGQPIFLKVIQQPTTTTTTTSAMTSQNVKFLTNIPSKQGLGPSNGEILTPTIVSSTSLANMSTSDNDDIEIIESPVLPSKPSNPVRPTTFPSIHHKPSTSSAISIVKPTLPLQSTSKLPLAFQTNAAPKILLTAKNSILSLAQLPQPSSSTSTTATLNPGPATSSILILNSPQSSNTQNFLTLLPKSSEPNVSSNVKVSPQTVKTSSAVQKKNTPGPASKTAVKLCEFCKLKTSQFLCAGCSNRSYCSRNCQERDWDSHADRCL